jgi:hypothetical protein
MRYTFTILFFLYAVVGFAQPSKKERQVLANSSLLMQTVFGTKDSLVLEKLFASTLSYVHSSGKSETREQALHGIVNNKSVYTETGPPNGYKISANGDSLVVKHIFQATEKKTDGSESLLNLLIEMVWIQEKGDWKLARRQATKN